MPDPNPNLIAFQKSLQASLDLLKGVPTRDEFLKAFEAAMKLIIQSETKMVGRIDNIIGASSVSMKAECDSLVQKIKSDSSMTLDKVKSDALTLLEKTFRTLNDKVGSVDKALKAVEDKLATVQDGQDADEQLIIDTVLAKVPTIEEIEKDIPKLGEKIRDGLELLQGDERLDKSAIKGLDDELKRIESIKSTGSSTVMAVTRTVEPYDLSSQTNGVLKTFPVPGLYRPLYVMSSDFPTVLMLNNGFTYSATANTITLTMDNAPSTGSQLLFMYQT